jgi:hypothetical protein
MSRKVEKNNWRDIAETLYASIVLGATGEGREAFEWALFNEGMSRAEVQAHLDRIEGIELEGVNAK